jgi:putative transposase
MLTEWGDYWGRSLNVDNKRSRTGVLYGMARPIRIEFAGAIYHVMARGNDKRVTFRDDHDFRTFQGCMAEVAHRFDLDILGYCLMTNHVHLLIRTPVGGLSNAMKWLFGVYTMKFNHRHKRVGHLFQGRYKALLVDKDSYLLEVSRYIHLNPCRAGIVEHPEEYPWSSMRGIMQGFLKPISVLSQFHSLKDYRAFVLEGLGSERDLEKEIKHGAFLGPDTFVERIRKQHRFCRMREISFIEQIRGPAASRIEAILEGQPRLAAMMAWWMWGGASQAAIGRRYGISRSMVCKTIERARKVRDEDAAFRGLLMCLEERIQRSRTDPRETLVGSTFKD